MKGGFYNTMNLEKCGWTDPAVAASAVAAPERPNNYCKDTDNNVILDLYNKILLYELLTKMRKDIVKFEEEKKAFFKQKPSIGAIGDPIFNIFTINRYNDTIKKYDDNIRQLNAKIEQAQSNAPVLKKLEEELEKIKKDKQKLMDKKSQFANYQNIDKQLNENPALSELLNKNSKELIQFINKIKIVEPLKDKEFELNKFIKEYYDSVAGKWYNKCIDNIKLKSILGSLGDYCYEEYTKKLNEYFSHSIREYDNDIKCIVPFTNNPNNIFEHLKDKNFKIYSKLDDIYYELYKYTIIPAVSAEASAAASEAVGAVETVEAIEAQEYTNYLLDRVYTLHKKENISKKIEKQVLYPNYSSLHPMEQKLKKLSFILYNSNDKLNNLIFALKINTVNNIDKFLGRHMRNNTCNSFLFYNTYTLLDIFIISNKFHNYYFLQSDDLFYYLPYNTIIYTPEYYENKTDDKFIELIKEEIDKKKDINIGNIELSEEYEIQINNLKIINKYWDEQIKSNNLIINTYNYLLLLNIKVNPDLSNFEEINKKLKYSYDQIKMLILINLYKEIVENYFLHKFYGCSNTIKILLNVIYYKSIYNLDKVKNLINYSMQFNYLKTQLYHYDIDVKFKDYEQKYLPIQPILDPNKTYNEFYSNLFGQNPIKYIPYIYLNYKMFIQKDESKVTYYTPCCGEILIFNIINLLIYDDIKNDINPALLPDNTHKKIRDFYNGKTLELFSSNNEIFEKEFIPLIHNIHFFIIPDVAYVYGFHHEKNGVMTYGTEIRPTYINVCRILAHLFNIDIDDGKKIICAPDILKTIFLSFKGSIKDILLKKFIPSTVLDGNTFIINDSVVLHLNHVDILFKEGHGEMNIIGSVAPNDYIEFAPNESIYGPIIINDHKSIFTGLHLKDKNSNTNIVKKMEIIFSNDYFKNLFKQNIYKYMKSIITNIDYKDLITLLNYFRHADIKDYINDIIQETTDIESKILLMILIFQNYYQQIDFEKINIEKLKSIIVLSHYEYIYRLIVLSFKYEPMVNLFLKMGQVINDNIFNNILIYMNKNDLLEYIKLYKPKNFDMIKFCNKIKDIEEITNIVIEYLLTGVLVENQKIMFNKLYFDGGKMDNINNFIIKLALIYTYEKNEKNDMIINTFNQSLTILLNILMVKDIEDSESLEAIIGIILKYIIKMRPLVLSKELFEDKYYYCFFKSFIYYNKKFINNKIKYKLIDQKNIVERFITFISKIVPSTYENINNIFSSEISKELLESLRISIYPESIKYKLEEGEIDIGFSLLAHQAKYLKYKSKYLQLKNLSKIII